MGAPDAPAILLYDGECGFCSRTVLFLYARDPEARLRFAALASPVGAQLLARHALAADRSTVVLVDAEGAHVRSTAVLRAVRLLRAPWPALAALARLVPRRARDGVYRLVARHRHRLARAVDACARPTPALRARMLDETRNP